ncbi:MAG: hypothetical protein ACE5IM_02050, partial [Nitrospinota bacterium]
MRKAFAASLLLGLWLLTGCGLFGRGKGGSNTSGKSEGGPVLTRKATGPCPTFLVFNPQES